MTIVPILILIGAVVLAVTLELWFAYLDSRLVGFPEWPLGFWTLAFWMCVLAAGGASGIIAQAEVSSKWLPLVCVGFFHTLINFCCGDSVLRFRWPDSPAASSCGKPEGDRKKEHRERCPQTRNPESRGTGYVDQARGKEINR